LTVTESARTPLHIVIVGGGTAGSNWFERVRDYIVAHYQMNSRGDLAAELERQNAGIHFGVMSWHRLLAGYGSLPELAPNQPGNHKGDRYHELELRDFLHRCALNFKPL
jgi:hypothetical protein